MAKSRKRKPRDYKAEYARRIARATKLGIPRAVARGHAPKGTAGIRLAKILQIRPGESIDARPCQTRPTPDYVGPSFEERLERAGFGSWIQEQRRKVLKRETVETNRRIKQLVTSQEDFVAVLIESEHSEREAYTQWFSPR